MNWNEIKTIAIVGASTDPERDSNKVMRYFMDRGFNVIPVNPNYSEVLGRICYPSLSAIPSEIAKSIDMVDVFRRSEFVLPIMLDAIKLKNRYNNLKVVWLQLGAENDKAIKIGRDAGLEVVYNACAMITHKSLKQL